MGFVRLTGYEEVQIKIGKRIILEVDYSIRVIPHHMKNGTYQLKNSIEEEIVKKYFIGKELYYCGQIILSEPYRTHQWLSLPNFHKLDRDSDGQLDIFYANRDVILKSEERNRIFRQRGVESFDAFLDTLV